MSVLFSFLHSLDNLAITTCILKIENEETSKKKNPNKTNKSAKQTIEYSTTCNNYDKNNNI